LSRVKISVNGYFERPDRTLHFCRFPAPIRRGRGATASSDSSEASMLRFACAVLVAATATVNSASLASSASPFDGRWSVVIETDKGDCDPAYRYGLQITNGNVKYAGDSTFAVNGRVARNGNIHVRVARGGSYADGHGRLSRDGGSGSWKGVGAGVCSGHWVAERRE
jgi:hypothetical protein